MRSVYLDAIAGPVESMGKATIFVALIALAVVAAVIITIKIVSKIKNKKSVSEKSEDKSK